MPLLFFTVSTLLVYSGWDVHAALRRHKKHRKHILATEHRAAAAHTAMQEGMAGSEDFEFIAQFESHVAVHRRLQSLFDANSSGRAGKTAVAEAIQHYRKVFDPKMVLPQRPLTAATAELVPDALRLGLLLMLADDWDQVRPFAPS